MTFVMFIFGVLVGFIIAMIIKRFTCSGTLLIDRFNLDKELYRFVIDDLDSLGTKRYITMKVDKDADLSQK